MRSGIKSLNLFGLNDAELVQFMKADFGSRYAARMALRHPLFTLRQVYHMVKKI